VIAPVRVGHMKAQGNLLYKRRCAFPGPVGAGCEAEFIEVAGIGTRQINLLTQPPALVGIDAEQLFRACR
jgi:hypothetical protein